MNVPSILSVKEIFKDVGVTEDSKGMKATRVFLVHTSEQTDPTEISRAYAQGIPKRNSFFSATSNLILKNKQIALYDDEFHWKVTCTYEAGEMGGGNRDENDEEPDPIDETPIIEIDPLPFTRVVERAYKNGDTRYLPTDDVANSAADPFNPTIVDEDYDTLITVQRNESDFDMDMITKYQNTLNSTMIRVGGVLILAHQGWLRKIKPVKKYKADGTPYYQITYEIVVCNNPAQLRTHIKYVLDAGYYQILATEKTEITVKDSTGKDTPVTEPQKLDGNGVKLAESGTPVYLAFRTKWALSWFSLNLPEAF